MAVVQTDLAGLTLRGAARSATSTTWATACSSSPPTASPPSTWCCPTRIPGQGRGAHAALGLLVRAPRDVVPNHLIATRRARTCPRAAARTATQLAGPLDARAQGRAVFPVECVVRGYLAGSGLEGVPGDRRGVRHRAAARACASPSGCPSRSSRPATKAEAATTRTSPSTRWPTRRRPSTTQRAARSQLALYRRGRRLRRQARGIIIADTKFEFGLARRRAHPDRRGAHARLLALLAGRRSTRPAGAQPSFDKQFVRD